MVLFKCPICGEELYDFEKSDKSLKCGNNHVFDKSSDGYVNLLVSNKSKNHGDDKLMVKARAEFLHKGFYKPLLDSLVLNIGRHIRDGDVILDAGCGECWYSDNIYDSVNKNIEMICIDISKNALRLGAKKNRHLKTAVASVYDMPVGDDSIDMVLNIFSPFSYDEYKRVLKKDGILIYVIPLENHLFGLKEILYENPRRNILKPDLLESFVLSETVDVKFNLTLYNNTDIVNLFKMTPYYYKTGIDDHKKINDIGELTTDIEFRILIYKIIGEC